MSWRDPRTFCTRKRRAYFLFQLATNGGNVSQATAAVKSKWKTIGPNRRTWYRLRSRDPEFADAWNKAIEIASKATARHS
jgi:hypothetical protein